MLNPSNLCLQTMTRLCGRDHVDDEFGGVRLRGFCMRGSYTRASVPSPVRTLSRVCFYSLPCRHHFRHASLGAARGQWCGFRLSLGTERALFILRAGKCAWRGTLHGQTI